MRLSKLPAQKLLYLFFTQPVLTKNKLLKNKVNDCFFALPAFTARGHNLKKFLSSFVSYVTSLSDFCIDVKNKLVTFA